MRIWCVLRIPAVVRFFVPVLERLAREEVDLVVSFSGSYELDAETRSALEWTRSRVPTLELEPLDLAEGPWARRIGAVGVPLRELRSYAEHAAGWPPPLQARWHDFLPRRTARAVRALERRRLGSLVTSRPLALALAGLERLYPPPDGLRAQLRRLAPSLVLASPLIYPHSREADVVKAAQRAGVPTVGFVLSWDNLSSKGTFHARPERLFVWNEIQRREAVELHGIGPERIDVVGAPVFDYVFSDALRRERGPLLASLGLASDARYVLYAVSSAVGLGAGGEVEIVERLARALTRRLGDRAPVLLVRPHPKNLRGFEALAGCPGIHLWPSPGFPHTEAAREGLYNSVFHADAVVGLSTSLFLEAAVLDRPCVAILLRSGERARVTPSAFMHFSYLSDAGMLEAVDDEQAAAEALARIVERGEDGRAHARAAFVRSFLRPHGVERDAADVAAERLLELARA